MSSSRRVEELISFPQSDSAAAWPVAKIRSPRPPVVASRRRLVDAVTASVTRGHVTLVVAPGGTGKTVLLADWTRCASIPVAWYSIDTADRDTRRLLGGICAAVERVAPGTAGPALATLEREAPEAATLGVLLGALERTPLALVLDDFHHLDGQPEAAALWDHLLRFRPPSLALIIVSRSVPLLSFAALAALDEVTGLGRAELSFDAAEAGELLAAHGLDADRASEFTNRSGGWAAGLLLLARAAPDGVRFLRARTEALMEHLGGEIVAALPDDLRHFLVESAALGPASPEETDTILGRRNSTALYAAAAARGLFLDLDSSLYRYHDLFAEYLVGVLRAANPVRLREIRRSAATWWTEHGDVPRALAILAADEDWESLAATLERERVTLWTQGLVGTVLAHMDRLPVAFHSPRLLTLCGYARSRRGEHAEALALADAGMARAADDEEWLSSALLRVQALVYAERNEDAIRSAEAALGVASTAQHERATTFLQESRGAANLRLGRIAAGRADLLAALTVHERTGDENGQARTFFNLATQLIGVGHAAEAGDYLMRADVLWRRLGNTAVVGDIHNSRALLAILTGDVAVARQEAAEARQTAHENGAPLLECEAIATLAQVCADAGNAAEAERHAVTAAEMAARLDMAQVLNTALRARISAALLRRDRTGARRLLDQAQPLAVTPYDHALLTLLDGILALRSGACERAADVLAQAAGLLEHENRPHSAARAHLLCAEALLATGSVRRAEDALNRCAELALPLGCEGYLRPVARLARRVLAERRVRRHLRRDTHLLLDRLAATAGQHLALLPAIRDAVPAPQPVALSPFGSGYIRLSGHDVEMAALPVKARELLFFSARRMVGQTRDEILDTVWSGDIVAVPAFWEAGRHLRRLLGEGSWARQDGRYALHIPVHDESRRFDDLAETALSRAAPLSRLEAAEQALDIVAAGDYLVWCDSLWALTERNHFAARARLVRGALAQAYLELGRAADAVATWRRAIALDRYDEAPRLALIQHLAAMGRMRAAWNEYTAYHTLLRTEVHAAPSARLRALAASLNTAARRG